MGFGRYFNGGNIVQMAVALSLMRPDSQSYIGQGTTGVVPNHLPYNMTNAVFNPMMSPGGTSASPDRLSTAKEADNQDPLSRFLDWHVNKNHFNNDAVAMLFEGGPPCPPRAPLASDSESGYSSEGVLSPSALTTTEPCADLSMLGAAGYTPPRSTATETHVLDLDDFLDLDAIEHIPAVKTELLSPMLGLEGVPDVKLQPFSENTCFAPTRDLRSPRKGTLEEIDLLPSFEFDVDSLYDPFSTGPTSEALQLPNAGTGIDDLDFDFEFPPDILTPIVGEDNPEEDLLSQVLISEYKTPSIGSDIFSEFSAEESLRSLPDSALRYATSATDIGGLKVEPLHGFIESSRIPTELPTNATQGGKDTLPNVCDTRLIDLPVNDFNELVLKFGEEDAQNARDVRRRGKNKEAARLCRKRKIEAIGGLDSELLKLQEEKARIMDERHNLQEDTLLWKNKLEELEGYVFKSLRDGNGLPLSPREYSLFQGSNGNVYVGKDINAKRSKKDGLTNQKAGK